MQVAGIRQVGAGIEMIDVGEPRPLADDEVLLEVRAAGVGNWDEFVRTGGWDTGAGPPMALGVEAAGLVMAAGQAVRDWVPGDAVMTHPVPLRDQSIWPAAGNRARGAPRNRLPRPGLARTGPCDHREPRGGRGGERGTRRRRQRDRGGRRRRAA